MSKIHELNFLEPIWSQWPQISSPKLSLDEKSLPRKFLGRLDFTRFIDNPSRLLDDCCYSTRTYCTSTLTVGWSRIQKLICYVFCRLLPHLMDILHIIFTFSGGNVAPEYHDFRQNPAYHTLISSSK